MLVMPALPLQLPLPVKNTRDQLAVVIKIGIARFQQSGKIIVCHFDRGGRALIETGGELYDRIRGDFQAIRDAYDGARQRFGAQCGAGTGADR